MLGVHGGRLVVCCRLNEYRWLPECLKLNGAICLEPLNSEEVGKYLAGGGSKLAALHQAVTSDPVLQEPAQTPLMLSVMSLAYQKAAPREFAVQQRDSPEKRREQIFGLYAKQMFQREGTMPPFPKGKTITWLSWLAQKMREHSQSVFLVEGLQASWLGIRGKQAAYGTVVALSVGLIGVSIGGLPGASFYSAQIMLICWLGSGLLLAFIAGFTDTVRASESNSTGG